ncbi:MAG: hypothetical protein QOF97_169 [Acidimicrobiaceae bacterium]|jgi:hypothetical protein
MPTGDDSPETPARQPIEAGTSIEVRGRFDGRWCGGFEVADTVEADPSEIKYRVRRRSDGAILPVLFADDDIASVRSPDATGQPSD